MHAASKLPPDPPALATPTLPPLLEAIPLARPAQLWLPAPWAVVLAGPADRPPPRRRLRARGPEPLPGPAAPTRLVVTGGGAAPAPSRPRKCSPHARARTINVAKLSLRERQGAFTGDLFYDHDLDLQRPKTRADCIDGPRPCPWIGCRYHKAIDVNPHNGSMKEVFPDLGILADPEGPGLEQMEQLVGTCALDTCDEMDDGTAGIGGLILLNQAASSGRPLGQTPGMTIQETATKLNLSIERTRQISAAAMQNMRVHLRVLDRWS